jgi:hypothetical protein
MKITKNDKKEREKTIESPNLSVLKNEHANKWVALSPDYKKLLAVGDSLLTVIRETRGLEEKVVIKVLPNLGYAPVAV